MPLPLGPPGQPSRAHWAIDLDLPDRPGRFKHGKSMEVPLRPNDQMQLDFWDTGNEKALEILEGIRRNDL